jgi:LysR family hydrogen peroxide-inducible transcriptional activator
MISIGSDYCLNVRSGPTVAQLRAFVAIADHQSFRDAAVVLRVSQPTLSQALATMEANLGVQLVERNPRRVLLTPEGRALLPLARQAVDAVDAFRRATLPDTWLAGPLHVGLIQTVAPYLLPCLLPAVRREAPDLALRVREDQTRVLLDALADGALDVAIVAAPSADARLRVEPLYDEDLVLAVPSRHPWAGREDLRPEELRDEDLMFLAEGHCLGEHAVEVCRASGMAHPGTANPRAASLSTILRLVSAGLGMTFVPASALRAEMRTAQVGVARFADPVPGRRIVLAWRRSSTRVEEFEDLAEIVRRAVVKGMTATRPAV